MRCFVINLDRSPDRLAFMQEQCTRLRVPWQRVPAVDGGELALPNPQLVDEAAFNRRHHALLRRGEIGCYLSHHLALQLFLRSDAESALILEDDVALSSDLPRVLDMLARCADTWDLVKLYATHPSGIITRRRLNDRHRLVSLAFRHGSSAAYVVSRAAATKLVAGMLPMTVPYDHEFDRAWKYGYRLRAVMPFAVSRIKFASTITATVPLDPAARVVNRRMHKPWHAQGGMVLFRGANDVARIIHELRAR
jgi:glycosyl transferase family 25